VLKTIMNNILPVAVFFFMFPVFCNAQDDSTRVIPGENSNKGMIYGFVRAGLYGGMDDVDNKPYISSAFSDFGIRAESSDGMRYKLFADLRFRYGTEFLKPVNNFDLREAYIRLTGKRWDATAGQQIIKWGRTDFTNPVSKLSPRNFVSRSPDRDDMDMGNLMLNFRWYPASVLSIEAVAIPYYRSSVLLIDPLPLPDYVTINEINSLITDKKMFTYGARANIHAAWADMSLSWFDGYDPMPGTRLSGFNLDMSGSVPVPYTELTMTPYKIRNFGFDFETTAGSVGLRGEATYLWPYESYKTYEYVPLREVNWVAGLDWTTGDWRLILEYSGKTMPGFVPSAVDPVLGSEPDYAELAALLATPGFDMEEYVREQVGAFNRLYNYQMEKTYHSAGFRIEKEMSYGKVTPSLFTLYNFTSRDLIIMPELIIKPADGLTISAGYDFYSGRKGSLFDMVDEFMNCIRVGVRVDF
jgi:hypothetical protein